VLHSELAIVHLVGLLLRTAHEGLSGHLVLLLCQTDHTPSCSIGSYHSMSSDESSFASCVLAIYKV